MQFLGGTRVVAHESILENERLEREFQEVHLFMPGAFGWTIPRSNKNLSSNLYHLASSGAVKILSLNAFSLEDVDSLLSEGRLSHSTVEHLVQRACPELCPAVLRVRHLRDSWGEAILERGSVLEDAAGGCTLVVQEAVAFELPPMGRRELLLPCLRFRPPPPPRTPPPPRGPLALTPFALDVPEMALNPLESHRCRPAFAELLHSKPPPQLQRWIERTAAMN